MVNWKPLTNTPLLTPENAVVHNNLGILNSLNGAVISIQSNPTTTPYSLQLPTTAGTAGQALISGGSGGVLEWGDIGAPAMMAAAKTVPSGFITSGETLEFFPKISPGNSVDLNFGKNSGKGNKCCIGFKYIGNANKNNLIEIGFSGTTPLISGTFGKVITLGGTVSKLRSTFTLSTNESVVESKMLGNIIGITDPSVLEIVIADAASIIERFGSEPGLTCETLVYNNTPTTLTYKLGKGVSIPEGLPSSSDAQVQILFFTIVSKDTVSLLIK